MKRVIYIIPESEFFDTRTGGGQVAHALNLAEGLSVHSDLILYGHKDMLNFNLGFAYESVPCSKGLIGRLFFPLKLLFTIRRKRVDIYLVRKTAFFLLWYPLYRVCVKGKLILEINGLSGHNSRGKSTNSVIKKILYHLHAMAFRTCDGIYTVTDTLRDVILENYDVPMSKLVVIPNGSKKRMPVICRGERKTILFYGVFQPYNNFSLLLSAAQMLTDVDFVFVGFGPKKEMLESAAKDHNNVKTFGRMSLDELSGSGIITSNTIGIVPMRNSEIARNGSPVKLYDYLSLGLQLLVSSNTDTNREIGPTKIVTDYRVDDLGSLVDSINSAFLDRPADLQSEVTRLLGLTSWEKRAEMLMDSEFI